MSTFTGTNLPPTIRLEGSADVAFRIRHDTSADVLPPANLPLADLVITKLPMEISQIRIAGHKDVGINIRRKFSSK